MAAAWAQVGDVLDANRRIRLAQLAELAAASLVHAHARALAARRSARSPLTAPVHAARRRRRRDGRGTARVRAAYPPALISAAMRRVVRPRRPPRAQARLHRRGRAGDLLGRVDAGAVSAAPPKADAAGRRHGRRGRATRRGRRPPRRGRRTRAPAALARAPSCSRWSGVLLLAWLCALAVGLPPRGRAAGRGCGVRCRARAADRARRSLGEASPDPERRRAAAQPRLRHLAARRRASPPGPASADSARRSASRPRCATAYALQQSPGDAARARPPAQPLDSRWPSGRCRRSTRT